MRTATDSWRRLNPEYHWRYVNDTEQRAQVHRLGSRMLVQAYDSALTGAARCDLWRALIIYKHGGVYADVDTTLLTPLSKLIRDDDEGLSGIGQRGDLHQWFLACAPGHPLLAHLLRHAMHQSSLLSPENIAGPRALHHVHSLFEHSCLYG
ncbi:hypothetical protein EMIHUDRAFT_227827 [Emiliania huxleyi CCMP1516]|uniref:Alpha 1,4-glycosyltransferase domain-containing protein n=2 Tax=Emiliania huxleyi TaxID=2903 RepID=A0A0D3KH35_EMIH1|nr:hypothetical protein EMIHUDRAFT_227827 [Emiliania huxleyi CCMP1516]EOD35070.1 hypothetical protein EMIHUDRAFT_227827 [Emiliania huxleyi CCMP1516]|eukprot:XP_005787499.1 hypothetical protein EMIHUDRAFT_227827 [Emiliania huxleyi CCMP1516]